MKKSLCIAFLALSTMAAPVAIAQPVQPVVDQAKVQKEPFLATLKQLVEIESGSYDRDGLDRIAEVVASKLRGLGGRVEVIETPDAEITRTERTPARLGKTVRATFKGKGTRSVLLIAHMDTVYEKGQGVQQPFRIEGNRVYGLGIADDKQGIALIIHAVALLQALKFDDFGTLTVLVNGDEEVGSPASHKLITAMGKSHDATMSFEGSSVTNDRLSLTTAGIGSVKLTVRGRASHAGSSPHLGVNALYELAHQIMQTRDLSDPATGTKLNWTLAKGGTVINMITPEAEATADVRVLKVEEYKVLDAKVQERIKNQLLPEAKVTAVLSTGRPPLVLTPASRALAEHSKQIYREIGREIQVEDTAAGGGTDAAFAALEAGGKPVVERYGLQGFGAHSSNAEYVALDSIEPRLYLAVRTIMDIVQGKVRK